MSSEVEKAKGASMPGAGEKTIFQKILDKEIPCKFIHEDDMCVAFDDVAPQAPVHFLVIPKKPIAMVEKASEEDEKVNGCREYILNWIGKILYFITDPRALDGCRKQGCEGAEKSRKWLQVSG